MTKVSDLLAVLEAIKAEHGDLPIFDIDNGVVLGPWVWTLEQASKGWEWHDPKGEMPPKWVVL